MKRWALATAPLAIVAGLLAWRITRADHAATPPAPTFTPTYPGTPDAALREPAEPVAVSATPYPPGDGVQVRLVTDHGLYAVDTARGTTVDLTREFTDPVGAALALPHGWAALVGPDDPKQSRRLVVEVGGRRTVTRVPGRELRAGTGDDFWTGDYKGVVQHRDATGAAVGAPVRLQRGRYLVRATVTGLLVERVGDGSGHLEVYDPKRARVVRSIPGQLIAAGLRHVLWQENTGRTWITDLTSGTERAVALPRDQFHADVADDGSVAYGIQQDPRSTPGWASRGPAVYVLGPGETTPRLLARAPIFEFYPVWIAPGRLAVVLATQTQSILYGWERGELRFAGAYHLVVHFQVMAG